MATFIFENMTQAQAAGLSGGNTLVFFDTSVSALDVGVSFTPGNGLSNDATSLTVNGKTLDFASSAISDTTIEFNDGSVLTLGSGSADTALTGTTGNDVIYLLGGDDTIDADAGHDYVFGGIGADTIAGGDDNDHLYGNSNTSTVGATDGADSINGGAGNDFLQGNVGADTLLGDVGNDRIWGGQNGDVIEGGAGNDVVNGNIGADTIDGGAGNDILRGGQDGDLIDGGADNDIIYGDLGAGTLAGGTGYDVLFGGDGADVFSFAAGDADILNIGTTGALANVVDIIADYVDGEDKIDLPTTGAVEVLTGNPATVFGSLLDAQTQAQFLLTSYTGTDHAVAALVFGGNTYLFTYEDAAVSTAIDTVIQVAGVAPTVFGASDFV